MDLRIQVFNILESQEHQLVGIISNDSSSRVPPFTIGELITDSFSEGQLKVEFESKYVPLPDYFELDAIPIVSNKFVEVWLGFPIENYQLFPVIIRFSDNELVGYSILNIVGRISCVDIAKSDCKMYLHRIMRINNMVLNYDSIKENKLFRAKEYPLVIFISNLISEKLSRSGLSGMLIEPAGNWNDTHRF